MEILLRPVIGRLERRPSHFRMVVSPSITLDPDATSAGPLIGAPRNGASAQRIGGMAATSRMAAETARGGVRQRQINIRISATSCCATWGRAKQSIGLTGAGHEGGVKKVSPERIAFGSVGPRLDFPVLRDCRLFRLSLFRPFTGVRISTNSAKNRSVLA